MDLQQLPAVDEHAITIDATASHVWPALLTTVDRAFRRPAARRYASLVGCSEPASSGSRPLHEGATVPGFRVVAAVPEHELALQGHHRFSSYALIFHIEALSPSRVRLTAQTRALFPGPAGLVYRTLVIGTGAHVRGVHRLLAAVRRRAEHA